MFWIVDWLMWSVGGPVLLVAFWAVCWTALDVWHGRNLTIEDNSGLLEPAMRMEEPIVGQPIAYMTLEQLMDRSIDNRRDARRIEAAVCKLLRVHPQDGSKLYDDIVAAVYDPKLFCAQYDNRLDSRSQTEVA